MPYGDVARPSHASMKQLCEYLAAEALVGWYVGSQVKDINLLFGSVRFLDGGNAYLRIYDAMASHVWQMARNGFKYSQRTAPAPNLWNVMASDLVRHHPLPNKGGALDLRTICWHQTCTLLTSDEAKAAVRALAELIEDKRELAGLEVADLLSIHLKPQAQPLKPLEQVNA